MTDHQRLERFPAVTYTLDAGGRLLSLDGPVEELLGASAAELQADPRRWAQCLPEHGVGPVPHETETRWVLRQEQPGDDGTRRGVLVDAAPAREYLDAAATLFLVIDARGRVQLANRAAGELLGMSGQQLRGKKIKDLVPPEDNKAIQAMLTGELGDVHHFESTRTDVHGERRVTTWQAKLLRDPEGGVLAAVASGLDVTERREAEEQIAHLAFHDALTGLPNRALLQEHLDLALARARRQGDAVALLYLDLDDFKLVNDSLGHQAGDTLLSKVAARLLARRRDSDLLARHGGDEFLLLLSDLDPQNAEDIARSAATAMLGNLQTPFVVAGAEFHIGASVGISLYPRDAHDAETLLRHADAAMYQGKSAGRDEVRVFEGDRDEPLRRLSMTSRLRAAISEEELIVHWQPIVDPATGTLESLEALVRWQDPLRGLLLPGEFVPFAEETGLIRRLGAHVLELICRQRKAWGQMGFDPAVTMNVSPRQLIAGFPQLLLDVQARHGVDPSKMTIEITESAAMQDAERVEPILVDLAATGARIAIDDFGAGYSSLSRLRRLPVGMLKIDRQFLIDAPNEPTATAIVTAVVELSEALGMQTVAEGVEGEDQRAFLVRLNCPLAQGFLLGRPLPTADATRLLAEQAQASRI